MITGEFTEHGEECQLQVLPSLVHHYTKPSTSFKSNVMRNLCPVKMQLFLYDLTEQFWFGTGLNAHHFLHFTMTGPRFHTGAHTHGHMDTQTYTCWLIRVIDIIIDVTGLFAKEMREM